MSRSALAYPPSRPPAAPPTRRGRSAAPTPAPRPQPEPAGRGRRAARLLREAVVETAWPTRCAVCDEPGAVLCDRCADALAVIDRWDACPRCGAPWGRVQCSECNPVMLAASGREALPYAEGAAAVILDEAARAVVVTYKDRGERRLASVMAARMAACAPPAWVAPETLVTFVPASGAARRRRGFDHGEELACAVAGLLGLACAPLLRRPRAADQRRLSRAGRAANMAGSLAALPGATAPGAVIVVDDVATTGATLCAAAEALAAAGAGPVYALTFARA